MYALHIRRANFIAFEEADAEVFAVLRQAPAAVRSITLDNPPPPGTTLMSHPISDLAGAWSRYVAVCDRGSHLRARVPQPRSIGANRRPRIRCAPSARHDPEPVRTEPSAGPCAARQSAQRGSARDRTRRPFYLSGDPGGDRARRRGRGRSHHRVLSCRGRVPAAGRAVGRGRVVRLRVRHQHPRPRRRGPRQRARSRSSRAPATRSGLRGARRGRCPTCRQPCRNRSSATCRRCSSVATSHPTATPPGSPPSRAGWRTCRASCSRPSAPTFLPTARRVSSALRRQFLEDPAAKLDTNGCEQKSPKIQFVAPAK